jgi:integrase
VVGSLFFYSQRKELTMRVTITNELIQGVRCPDDKKKIELVPTAAETRGWYLECARGCPGQGIHRFRYKCPSTGKTKHIRIGSTNEISLVDAMAKAREFRQRLDAGLEPVVIETPKPTMPTLIRFFEDEAIPYLKTRKRGWEKDQQIFNYRLKKEFGDMKLDEITRPHAQSYLTRLIERDKLAPATANHHVKLLRQVLNIALDWDIISKNPVARVRLLPISNNAERYMTEEQLGKLLDVLATYPARNACNVALFLLSTGARLNEALSAKWENIDREHRVWRIPAADSKSKRVRAVPLGDVALEVLDQLGSEGQHEWLFVTGGRRYRHMHQVWNRIRNKAGMPWLRVHDLRHAAAQLMINAGRTLYEVQAVLGHASPQITTRYATLSTRTLQDAVGQVSKAISDARERAG